MAKSIQSFVGQGLIFNVACRIFVEGCQIGVEHGIDNRLGRKAGFMSGKVCPTKVQLGCVVSKFGYVFVRVYVKLYVYNM